MSIHWACTVCGDGSNSTASAINVEPDATAHQKATGHFAIYDDGRDAEDECDCPRDLLDRIIRHSSTHLHPTTPDLPTTERQS